MSGHARAFIAARVWAGLPPIAKRELEIKGARVFVYLTAMHWMEQWVFIHCAISRRATTRWHDCFRLLLQLRPRSHRAVHDQGSGH